MIRFIKFKPHVTPVEQAFIAQWLGLKQGAMPLYFLTELPRPVQ